VEWNYGYFYIDPTFKWTCGSDAVVRIEFLSRSEGKLGVQYDWRNGPYHEAPKTVQVGSEGQWTTEDFLLKDARFENSQNDHADFRIWLRSAEVLVRRVSVFCNNPLGGPIISDKLPTQTLRAAIEAGSTSGLVADILRTNNDLLVRQALNCSNILDAALVLGILDEKLLVQPTNQFFSLARANVLDQLGRTNEAIAALSAVIALTSDTNAYPRLQSDAFRLRSNLFLKLGRLTEAGTDNCLARNFPLRHSATPPKCLDLSPYYNGPMRLFINSDGREVQRAFCLQVREKTDVEFDARGYIRLVGNPTSGDGILSPPKAISNIPIASRCAALHFLHSADGWVDKGTTIGWYRLNLADRTTQPIPIIYGVNVRGERGDQKPVANATVAWTGESFRTHAGTKVTVFKATWKNPKPGVEVNSLDFISALTESSPILLAITVEP
jgi:hypothetical protein